MRTVPPEPPRQAATRLSGLLGEAVILGHHALPAPLSARCSCGVTDCPAPGAHPLDGTAGSEGPWSVLLPLGRRYDALDVPLRTGEVGLGHLRVWGVPLGPVLEQAGRMVFLVQPEARDDLAWLTVRERLGDPRRGIRYRGDGHQPLPPSNAGTSAQARWAVSPGLAAGRLPCAAELLRALAFASHQLRRLHGQEVRLAVGL